MEVHGDGVGSGGGLGDGLGVTWCCHFCYCDLINIHTQYNLNSHGAAIFVTVTSLIFILEGSRV